MTIGSTGVLAPGKLRWLRALGWLGTLCVTLVLAFNAVAKAGLWLMLMVGGNAGQLAAAPPLFKLAAALVGCLAIVAGYWIAVRLGEKRRVPELALGRAAYDGLVGMAIGAFLMAVIVGMLWAFGWVVVEQRPVDAIALALRDSLRSGVVEELLLRLVIFRLLWRAFGIWPAIGGSAVVFGVLHLANPDSSLFAAACLIAGEGIGIGLFLLTGRIWASIGMHAAWNFTQGWLFGALVSGTTEIAGGPLTLRPASGVPQALSGGGFGPEASWVALVVSTLASAALLLLASKRGCFTAADGERRRRGT